VLLLTPRDDPISLAPRLLLVGGVLRVHVVCAGGQLILRYMYIPVHLRRTSLGWLHPWQLALNSGGPIQVHRTAALKINAVPVDVVG
jgi:hypothetical protein